MPLGKIFKHKGHHGGRYDDPHGVTAPKAMQGGVFVSKKMTKAIKKSGINDPEYRKQSAARGEAYEVARRQEQDRKSFSYGFDDKKPRYGSIEEAVMEGGGDAGAERIQSNLRDATSRTDEARSRTREQQEWDKNPDNAIDMAVGDLSKRPKNVPPLNPSTSQNLQDVENVRKNRSKQDKS